MVAAPADQVGPRERAWIVNGFGVVVDPALARVYVVAVAGVTPVACIPTATYANAAHREGAFAVAMIELCERRVGWLGLVRALGRYAVPIAATGVAALAMFADLNGDGVIDLVGALLAH